MFINGCVCLCVVFRVFDCILIFYFSVYRVCVICFLGENSLFFSERNVDNDRFFRIFLCVKIIESY